MSATTAILRRAPPLTTVGLISVIVGFALAVAPHAVSLPPWALLLAASAVAWRLTIHFKHWQLPPRYLRSLIAFIAMFGVAFAYRTLNGLEAGTALLTLMAGMKLLESERGRDLVVMLFICYFLLFASFLHNQGLLRLPYLLLTAWLLAVILLRIQTHSTNITVPDALRTTGKMLLQALPVAALLFVFFPRLPGQFWAVPAGSSSATGLSDELSPGDVSELSQSGAVAFRVKFEGEAPPPNERYWRAIVMHDFDGRTWRAAPRRAYPDQRIFTSGRLYSYRITMEANNRPWLPALDVPVGWPGTEAFRTFDYRLVTRDPITTLTSFHLQSNTGFGSVEELPLTLRRADLAIPGTANPRSRQFAQQLRAQYAEDPQLIQAVLRMFREQKYFYTLEPPRLAADSVDDFLFNTRRGFCEHFASAFTLLMRAAGIPARVVAGYQGGEFNPMSGALVVHQSEAHAWSEVWLEGRGWTRVDPTAAVAPERIEQGLEAAVDASEPVPGRLLRQSSLLAQARLTWDAINTFWNDRVVAYDATEQREVFSWLGLEDADWEHFGIALAVVLAVCFGGLSLFLAWQFRPRTRDPLVHIYAQLCRKLGRHDINRATHEGPNDFLRRAATARPQVAAQLDELRVLYTALRYGPSPSAQQLSRLRFLVNGM